jgi:hypothetical protein
MAETWQCFLRAREEGVLNLKNIGHGVCDVHKLRKLRTKYEMFQVRCNINFIIQVSEVPYVSASCVMK